MNAPSTIVLSRQEDPVSAGQTTVERIASIDVLRGFTILLMIFVNDIASVAGLPAWMKHVQPANADGMTFVDVIFPAFLFIVGMSIPFALRRRLESGKAMGSIWIDILTRTASLLLIGVFMVNSEGLGEDGVLSPSLWTILMYAGVILVWSNWPRNLAVSTAMRWTLFASGFLLLAAMAILFRGQGEPGLIELRPQWWGILGLIGWAYLVGCSTYLIARTNVAVITGVMAMLYLLYFANAAGAFAGLSFITNWVNIGSALGSHGALTVSGLVLGVILLPDSPVKSHAARIKWGLWFGAGMAAAAFLLHSGRDIHQMFIVNKIFATPAWALYSAAITAWTWAAIYWLLDVRKLRKGSLTLALAGQNALFAYILAPIMYASFALTAALLSVPNYYWSLGASPAAGLVRGTVLAVFICVVTAALRRLGYTLRV